MKLSELRNWGIESYDLYFTRIKVFGKRHFPFLLLRWIAWCFQFFNAPQTHECGIESSNLLFHGRFSNWSIEGSDFSIYSVSIEGMGHRKLWLLNSRWIKELERRVLTFFSWWWIKELGHQGVPILWKEFGHRQLRFLKSRWMKPSGHRQFRFLNSRWVQGIGASKIPFLLFTVGLWIWASRTRSNVLVSVSGLGLQPKRVGGAQWNKPSVHWFMCTLYVGHLRPKWAPRRSQEGVKWVLRGHEKNTKRHTTHSMTNQPCVHFCAFFLWPLGAPLGSWGGALGFLWEVFWSFLGAFIVRRSCGFRVTPL